MRLSLLCLTFQTQEPRKKLATWSTDDVCRWLTSLDLELYCESFRQNAIDGEELSHINSEVLASDLSIGERHVFVTLGYSRVQCTFTMYQVTSLSNPLP